MGLLLRAIKEFPLQTIMTITGVLVALLNLWLAGKFMPFISRMDGLDFRLRVVEAFQEENKPLIPRFLVSEEKNEQMVKDITEIKGDVNDLQGQSNRIEGKVDQINNKL